MFQSVTRKRLYEEVSEQIIASISSGELTPGMKLPSERSLSEMFQVSRTAIREATRSLESSGYIEVRPNGAYICGATMDKAVAPIMNRLMQDDRIADDLLELRLILEPMSAALVADRITADELGELEQIVCDMEHCVANGESCSQPDALFHTQLIAASHNEAIKSVYRVCQIALADMISAIGDIEGQPQEACMWHRRILDALQKRDSALARKEMCNHLKQVYTRLDRTAPLAL